MKYRSSWCKFTPAAQWRSPGYERQRDRNHNRAQTSQQRASPLDSEVREHLAGKEREACSNGRPENGVSGKHRGRAAVVSGYVSVWAMGNRRGNGDVQGEIGIDEVVETLQEYAENSESDEYPRCRWGHPVDIFSESRPAEPVIHAG